MRPMCVQEGRLKQLGEELKSELCSGSLAHLREMTSAFLQELKDSLGRQAQADLPRNHQVFNAVPHRPQGPYNGTVSADITNPAQVRQVDSKSGSSSRVAVPGSTPLMHGSHMSAGRHGPKVPQQQQSALGFHQLQYEATAAATKSAQPDAVISEVDIALEMAESPAVATKPSSSDNAISAGLKTVSSTAPGPAPSDDGISEEIVASELAGSIASSIPEESQAAVSHLAESVAESVSDYSMAFEGTGFKSPLQGFRSPYGQLHSPLPGEQTLRAWLCIDFTVRDVPLNAIWVLGCHQPRVLQNRVLSRPAPWP